MSKIKQNLLDRKKEIEDLLIPYRELVEELKEIQKVLDLIDREENCFPSCNGCDKCRRGPNYR